MSETCDCRVHGIQPAVLVCKHIHAIASGEIEGFVSFGAQHTDDLRTAWCEACEGHIQGHSRDDWTENSVQVPGGFHLLCAQCYRARESEARRAGRRFIHRA